MTGGDPGRGEVWAVVLAGGRGRRFGAAEPKQFVALAGRPVLAWALEALLAHPAVAGAVVPVADGDRARLAAEVLPGLGVRKPVLVCPAGAERVDSVRAGLAALPPGAAWVLIHDGARPHPTAGLIDRLLAARASAAAVIPVVRVSDTLKELDPAGRVVRTVDRDRLARAQTPQLFLLDLIRRAHAVEGPVPTDDAQLVERLGEPVATVEGDPANVKLTEPFDRLVLEALLAGGPTC